MERAEMERVERRRAGFMQDTRDVVHQCSVCKGKVRVIELGYANVRIVKVQPCQACMDMAVIMAEKDGYDRGYEERYERRGDR